VTLRTLISSDFGGSWDFDVFTEILGRFVGGLLLGFADNRWSDEKCYNNGQ